MAKAIWPGMVSFLSQRIHRALTSSRLHNYCLLETGLELLSFCLPSWPSIHYAVMETKIVETGELEKEMRADGIILKMHLEN